MLFNRKGKSIQGLSNSLNKPTSRSMQKSRSSSCKLVPIIAAAATALLAAWTIWIQYAWLKKEHVEKNVSTPVANKEKAPLPEICDPFFTAVEIGTSNFDTFIQEMEKKDPYATGLSADAMQTYINQLPSNMTCWTKVATAVVGKKQDIPQSGVLPTFFVEYDDMIKNDLPLYLRGCNSVGRPHPTAIARLTEKNMLHLLRNVSVPVQSVEQLLNNNNVCRMKNFKVNVEGMDGELLIGYAEWVASNSNKCYADHLTGEFNQLLNGRAGREAANEALVKVGYKMTHGGLNSKWDYVGTDSV